MSDAVYYIGLGVILGAYLVASLLMPRKPRRVALDPDLVKSQHHLNQLGAAMWAVLILHLVFRSNHALGGLWVLMLIFDCAWEFDLWREKRHRSAAASTRSTLTDHDGPGGRAGSSDRG